MTSTISFRTGLRRILSSFSPTMTTMTTTTTKKTTMKSSTAAVAGRRTGAGWEEGSAPNAASTMVRPKSAARSRMGWEGWPLRAIRPFPAAVVVVGENEERMRRRPVQKLIVDVINAKTIKIMMIFMSM